MTLDRKIIRHTTKQHFTDIMRTKDNRNRYIGDQILGLLEIDFELTIISMFKN